MDFSAEAERAFRAHDEAVQAVQDLRRTPFRLLSLDEASTRVAEAEAVLAPFREFLQVSPVPPPVYDALVAAHPPAAGDPPGTPWCTDTFVPALLAACVGQELPEAQRMSEQDWAGWIAVVGAGVIVDLNRLFRACLQVNNPGLDMVVEFR